MSGQPCSICYRWYTESFHVHNARHIHDNPHTFCRTINCGQDGCPVGSLLDGVAPHIPTTDYYDGRDGSIEAKEDDEESIADQETHREEWRDFLEWQRDLGA